MRNGEGRSAGAKDSRFHVHLFARRREHRRFSYSSKRPGCRRDLRRCARGRCHIPTQSKRKREAQMKLTLNVAAAAVSGSQSRCFLRTNQRLNAAGEEARRSQESPLRRPAPRCKSRSMQMKQQFQGEIDGLKADLATKDEQLKQAQQTAADAQAAAAKAEADATAQQQAFTENAAAVSHPAKHGERPEGQRSFRSPPRSPTRPRASRKRSASPDALHYKGITLSPAGSFLAAETVWRQGATGDDINTGAHQRSAAELRRRADERVLRQRPSVARRVQGDRARLPA